jgi:hypothetical protein
MKKRSRVGDQGAPAGAVLRGVQMVNWGLRLRIGESQPRGASGPIRGRFVLLDTGANKHSEDLADLVGRETDAGEVLRLIRRWSEACVNVVNANGLVVESAFSLEGSCQAVQHAEEGTAAPAR